MNITCFIYNKFAVFVINYIIGIREGFQAVGLQTIFKKFHKSPVEVIVYRAKSKKFECANFLIWFYN